MAGSAQDLVIKDDEAKMLSDLLSQMKEDLLNFSRCINEDAQTSNMYLNEILRMLTTGEKQIPITPIEIEVTNFNNHRTDYWIKRTQKLNDALSNFEKISQICNKFILQSDKKDV